MTTATARPPQIHDWPDWLGVHGGAPRTVPLVPRESAAEPFPWWERHDMWSNDQMFARPITWRPWGRDEWVPLADATGRIASRRTRVPERIPLPPERPNRPRTHMRRVIAMLAGWHQATTRQIAAWCGISREHLVNRVLRPLWQAGAIARGTFGTAFGRADNVWQLQPGDPLNHWLAQLDAGDWRNVTLGIQPGAPSGNHRHNLLVTELALRAAEAVPLAAVIGEPPSTADRLFSGYTGPELRGDTTFVRSDGLRIIIEFIREQHAHGFIGKLAGWGRYLGNTPGPHHTGTVVCFVLAPHDIDMIGNQLRLTVENTLTGEGLADVDTKAPAPPRTVAVARTQITVAAWPDWFPAPHDLSEAFSKLTAHYLDPNGTWGSVNLADPKSYKFRPAKPAAFALPLDVKDELWCTPQTLRAAGSS